MAKKAGPTRPCVNPDCGKPIHPRAKLCPHCKTEQPQKVKAKKTAKADLPAALQPSVAEFMRDMGKVVEKYGADTVASFAKLFSK